MLDKNNLATLSVGDKDIAPKKRRVSAAAYAEAIDGLEALIADLQYASMAVSASAPDLASKIDNFAEDMQDEIYALEDAAA